MPSFPPRRSGLAVSVSFSQPCCLRPYVADSTFGFTLFRGHIHVHFHYGPMTRVFPKETLVDRLQDFGFPPPCYPSYEALTITSAGLTPAEHASLSWTHNAACGFPALRSPVCFLSRFMWPIFWIHFQHLAMTNPITVKQL